MTHPIELYFWPTPNGLKISIALEEMALPYALKPVNISAGDQFKPDFLKISPNNRMPAIIDPEGPGGAPISVFESGAILQYLGRKTGKFYPGDERQRVAVEEWLFWQMANLGPATGQRGHFSVYAPKFVEDPAQLAYAQKRFANEVDRLYGVLDRRLADNAFLAGEYSIADMASWPWVNGAVRLAGPESVAAFPHLRAWLERVGARPAVQKGAAVGAELRRAIPDMNKDELNSTVKNLFGQTAQSIADAARANAN
ncbi:MAG: glutathione S-transferase N-terminal domain-containing protein [Hyphomonadaceae bacterium]|nr:glutathione S-transferase N-terminal domain-containing protein [Hyphomonadaceae bacterium]